MPKIGRTLTTCRQFLRRRMYYVLRCTDSTWLPLFIRLPVIASACRLFRWPMSRETENHFLTGMESKDTRLSWKPCVCSFSLSTTWRTVRIPVVWVDRKNPPTIAKTTKYLRNRQASPWIYSAPQAHELMSKFWSLCLTPMFNICNCRHAIHAWIMSVFLTPMLE
jgi:hypothetical protein